MGVYCVIHIAHQNPTESYVGCSDYQIVPPGVLAILVRQWFPAVKPAYRWQQ